jgi:hypothetical protein
MLTAGMISCLNEKLDEPDGISLTSHALIVARDGLGTANSSTSTPIITALVAGSLKFIYVSLKTFWKDS